MEDSLTFQPRRCNVLQYNSPRLSTIISTYPPVMNGLCTIGDGHMRHLRESIVAIVGDHFNDLHSGGSQTVVSCLQSCSLGVRTQCIRWVVRTQYQIYICWVIVFFMFLFHLCIYLCMFLLQVVSRPPPIIYENISYIMDNWGEMKFTDADRAGDSAVQHLLKRM